MKQFEDIFKTRDSAVEAKNKELFLSTQVEEIADFTADGYMNLKGMISKIIASEKVTEIVQIVFVKEIYSYSEIHENKRAYVLYKLIKTESGWKIYQAAALV
jgi:hypothetical protein